MITLIGPIFPPATVRAVATCCVAFCVARAHAGSAAGATQRDQALLSKAREILDNKNATEKQRLDVAKGAEFWKLRELKADLERLSKEDPSPKVRAVAARVLRTWEREDAETAERKAREEAIRREATMTPQERRDTEDKAWALFLRDQIREKLKSDKAEDRREVLASAGTWAKHLPDTIPILHNLARTDQNPGVRLQAMLGILNAQPDSPDTLALLRFCLGAENPPSVRGAAAEQLCERGDKAGLGVLIDQLSTDNIRFQAFTMKSLRGIAMKGDIGPPPSLLTKVETPKQQISEDEKRQIREGAAEWQRWWKEEGPAFVLPRARATQPSTRPTTEKGR